MLDRSIPSTMASQHPDNASKPSWAGGDVIAGDDEIHEAYYCFSRLGCREVMWDAEGKDTDPYVVRKLLTSYAEFFKIRRIGSDVFLTYRIPNPSVEVAEKKVFLEALESIPRSLDVAERFYGNADKPPVFEVILPFTTGYQELIRVKETYKRIVVDLFNAMIDFAGTRLKDWIGESKPKNVEVIPLVEDLETIVGLDTLLSRYIEIYSPRYMRVFIARSDPALNYGLLSATLLAKIALSKIRRVEEALNIPLHPIIGVGCLPFRGHNNPRNISSFAEEYKGVHTVTVQSSFRYDYPEHEVANAVAWYNENLEHGVARLFEKEEEEIIVSLIRDKLSPVYMASVEKAVDVVNYVSKLVPARRARRLHIGLFGYSRRMGEKALPRAIPFTAVFYSLGMPPEFIGLRALENLREHEYDMLREAYKMLLHDLGEAGRYVSWNNINLIAEGGEEVKRVLEPSFLKDFLPLYLKDLEVASSILGIKLGPRRITDRRYENEVNNLLISLIEGDEESARKEMENAARMRRSIG